MTNFFIKVFGFLIDFFWPGKLKEFQIKISRIKTTNHKEIQDFIEVYEETFPYDGSNYTAGELLEVFGDVNNKKKYVIADNILLVAKFKDSIVGFIACFYYPKKQYGIIGYFGKTKSFKEESKYTSLKLLKKLKAILVKDHKCKLIVFELEPSKKDRAKAFLFKLYAQQLNLIAYELDFEYYRPKLSLEDSKDEEKLALLVIPINDTIKKTFSKNKVLDILNFIHFYCYGDYYNSKDNLHKQFQKYMHTRMEFYKTNLPEKIKVI